MQRTSGFLGAVLLFVGWGQAEARQQQVGEKKILFIRVDFPDLEGEPISEASAIDLVDVQVGGFFRDCSYGKVTFQTTVTPVFRMPQPSTWYSQYHGPSGAALWAAQQAGYNTKEYFQSVVASKYVNGYATAQGMGPYIALAGSFDKITVAHEMGHAFGFPHASYRKPITTNPAGPGESWEYGHPYDIMGSGNDMRAQFGAQARTKAGWIPPSEIQSVTESGTHRIYALESAIPSGLHAITIRTGRLQQEYWVEFRSAYSPVFDGKMNGVMITENYGRALLDGTPLTSGLNKDAVLLIGRTFTDPAAGIHITPVRRGGGIQGLTPWVDVVVNLGSFSDNRFPQVTLSADALQVPTNTVVWFTASASDPDGDTVGYSWSFGDGVVSAGGARLGKMWFAEGDYVVQCEVSDAKGGRASAQVLVRVGSPLKYRIQGTIRTQAGQPLEGAFVTLYPGYVSSTWSHPYTAWTDSTGAYSIVNVPAGRYYVVPSKWNHVVNPGGHTSPEWKYVQLTRQATVGLYGQTHATGVDFTAGPYLETPAAPTGPSSSGVGQSSAFTLTIPRPKNLLAIISQRVDWGDGTTSVGWAWTSTVSATHAWSSPGIYVVRVMSFDPWGSQSGWSPPLQVTVP